MDWIDGTTFGTIMTAILGLYAYMYRMQRRVTRIETYLFNGVKLRREVDNGEKEA